MQVTNILTSVSIIVGVVTLVISSFLFLRQLRINQEWNRRKTSEEMLIHLITGDFAHSMDQLLFKFKWDILASVPYDTAFKRLCEENEKIELDVVLMHIFRFLEVICINMKHHIVDEDICYDYLGSILTIFHQNCETFIDKERRKRDDPTIFANAQDYGIAWTTRLQKEKEEIRKGGVQRGKRRVA